MTMSGNSSVMVVDKSAQLPVLADRNGLVSYFEKIKNFPVLSEDEEKALIVDFKQNHNLEAAHRLVVSHLRLAAKIALTYRHYLPLADLISEANIGLMQAVKKFDLEKKVRLSTYAIWWIKAAINDFILRSWSLVKIGTVAAQKKLFYNLGRIKAKLGIYENKALEPAVVRQIAAELVVDEKDVVEMNQRLGGDTSLNVSVGDADDDLERIDMLVDKRQNAEALLAGRQEAAQKHKMLQKCLEKLSDREAYIIRERMLTDKPQTLEDIGVKFAVSRERVRQIEKKAFEHLAALMKEEAAALAA